VEGENRLYTVLSVAGGLFCLAAALASGSALAAAIGAAFFFLTIALWKYGYAIVPALLRGANVVETGPNFEIPPSQDVVVGRRSGNFLATVFLSARLYESASEKGAHERVSAGEMFEKAIASAGFPFKVCCLVSPIEMRGELEEIRTKRSLAESRRAKLHSSKNDPEAARLDREISMWGRMIGRLTSGEKPLEVVFYLSTTGAGLTRDAAIEQAHRQAKELSVVVGAALACEVAELRGEEMKRCLNWELFPPSDSDDLHDQMF
jgi:hypothetical protein